MSEWKESKLGDAMVFQRGHDLPKSKMKDGYIPVAGSNGIIGFHDQSTTKGPGLTIGRSGNIGTPHYYPNDFWAHNTVLYVKDFKNNDVKFLFYFLHTLDFSYFNTGSAVPSLNRNHIHELDISIPLLDEQCAIAGILSSLDDKIDLLHRQNATLEKIAETLYRKWIEEKEFNNTISQFVSIQNGYAFKSKDFRETGINGVIKIKNISGGVIDISNTDYIDQDIADNTAKQFNITSGDVLIAMTGAEIGKLGIIPITNKKLWLNQRVGNLKEIIPGAKHLAYLHLKSELGQDYIENTATGSAQPNISGTGIENCSFPELSTNEIKEYSEIAGKFFDKIIFNLGQIHTLTALRDTLLPKLMSGEVRVKTE